MPTAFTCDVCGEEYFHRVQRYEKEAPGVTMLNDQVSPATIQCAGCGTFYRIRHDSIRIWRQRREST